MRKPRIEIYHAKICGLCHKALDYFRERGWPLTVYEVVWDGERFVDTGNAREMNQRCGDVDFVPQIFIDGRHISGWKTLEPLIQSGEIETYSTGQRGDSNVDC